jgi:membrane protein YdbS with pleckstrin-like domain
MPDQDQSHLPPSPDDDAARADAVKTIIRQAALWGLPVAALAVLCLLLGVPWWIVAGGVVAFAVIILFDM